IGAVLRACPEESKAVVHQTGLLHAVLSVSIGPRGEGLMTRAGAEVIQHCVGLRPGPIMPSHQPQPHSAATGTGWPRAMDTNQGGSVKSGMTAAFLSCPVLSFFLTPHMEDMVFHLRGEALAETFNGEVRAADLIWGVKTRASLRACLDRNLARLYREIAAVDPVDAPASPVVLFHYAHGQEWPHPADFEGVLGGEPAVAGLFLGPLADQGSGPVAVVEKSLRNPHLLPALLKETRTAYQLLEHVSTFPHTQVGSFSTGTRHGFVPQVRV
ncbi:unnamed protein product, partial [Discosporangium mesarthrocarpum]